MPVTQKVTLKIDKDGYVVAVPEDIPDRMIGDKMRFDSKDGKFKVEFDRWIFSGEKHPITDRRARTIKHRGPYSVDCSITTPRGQPAGYRGARGNVRP